MKVDPELLYRRLGALLADIPNLEVVDDNWNLLPESSRWLSAAEAVVDAYGDLAISVAFKSYRSSLIKTLNSRVCAREIEMALRDIFARLELIMPAGVTGAFIAAGDEFDSFAVLSKLIRTAKTDVLIVDPYLDASCLTDFGGALNEATTLRLLADSSGVRSDLAPAVTRWGRQFGSANPVELRISPARTLHDRLIIIDGSKAWVLTQSIKDFAKRSPATIQQVGEEIAALKIPAFEDHWARASPVVS